jgi:hypothetical protein
MISISFTIKIKYMSKITKEELKEKGIGDKAISMLDTDIEYTTTNGLEVKGKIIDIRHSMAVIVDTKTKDRSPAIEFKIKPQNGTRAIWSRPFHNR